MAGEEAADKMRSETRVAAKDKAAKAKAAAEAEKIAAAKIPIKSTIKEILLSKHDYLGRNVKLQARYFGLDNFVENRLNGDNSLIALHIMASKFNKTDEGFMTIVMDKESHLKLAKSLKFGDELIIDGVLEVVDGDQYFFRVSKLEKSVVKPSAD